MRLGDEHICDEMVQRVLRIVAEGMEGTEMPAEVLQLKCVDIYMTLRHEKYGVERLTQVASWVLGEYGFRWVEEGNERDHLVCRLLDLLDGACLDSTRNIVVTALAKVCARQKEIHPNVRKEIQFLASVARDVSLHQRCNELLALDQDREVLSEVLPDDGCCQDLHIDTALSFLDGMVRQALEAGGKPYTARDLNARPVPSPVPEEPEEAPLAEDRGLAPELKWRDVNIPPDPFNKGCPGATAEAEAAARLGKSEQQFARDLFAEPSQRELERAARQKRKEERERKRLEKEQKRATKASAAEAKARKAKEAAGRSDAQKDIFADIFAVPAKPEKQGPVADASAGYDFSSRQLLCCDEWTSLQIARCPTPHGLSLLLVAETSAVLSQVRMSVKPPSRMGMNLTAFPQNLVQAERQDSITWGPGIDDDIPAVLRVALQLEDGAFGSTLGIDCCYSIRGSSPQLLSACCHLGIADFIRCPPPSRLVDFSHRALWQQCQCESRGSAVISSDVADAAERCANSGTNLSIVSVGAEGAELAGLVAGLDEFVLVRVSVGGGGAEVTVRSRHHLLSQSTVGLLTRALSCAPKTQQGALAPPPPSVFPFIQVPSSFPRSLAVTYCPVATAGPLACVTD
eukprot:Hpha_TRINITY_DN16637_c1_g1::TRINITY_DN16637_c1_g1_i2::g.179129::m.179129/K12400/AP4E1; AP-4 complex subunit epsilon-1